MTIIRFLRKLRDWLKDYFCIDEAEVRPRSRFRQLRYQRLEPRYAMSVNVAWDPVESSLSVIGDDNANLIRVGYAEVAEEKFVTVSADGALIWQGNSANPLGPLGTPGVTGPVLTSDVRRIEVHGKEPATKLAWRM